MTKRIAQFMSLGKFRNRLQYKCKRNVITYKLVDEYYTSKLCSNCGGYNDIGSSKKYKCNCCENNIDRDINSAKNIYMQVLK